MIILEGRVGPPILGIDHFEPFPHKLERVVLGILPMLRDEVCRVQFEPGRTGLVGPLQSASFPGGGADEGQEVIAECDVIVREGGIILVCADVHLFGGEPGKEGRPDTLHCGERVGVIEV